MTNDQIIERLTGAIDHLNENGWYDAYNVLHPVCKDIINDLTTREAALDRAIDTLNRAIECALRLEALAITRKAEREANDLTTREADLEMLRSIGSHVLKSGLSKDEDIIRELRKGLDERGPIVPKDRE